MLHTHEVGGSNPLVPTIPSLHSFQRFHQTAWQTILGLFVIGPHGEMKPEEYRVQYVALTRAEHANNLHAAILHEIESMTVFAAGIRRKWQALHKLSASVFSKTVTMILSLVS